MELPRIGCYNRMLKPYRHQPSYFGGMTYTPGASALNSELGQYITTAPMAAPILAVPKKRSMWAEPEGTNEKTPTCRRIMAILSALELRFPFPVEVCGVDFHDRMHRDEVVVTMRMHVPDRANKNRHIWVHGTARLGLANELPRDGEKLVAVVLKAVRQEIHTLVSHEADESIYYQGERVFDPHPSWSFLKA